MNRVVPFQPWGYFFIFLGSNVLLSYFDLSFGACLCVGIFGLILPFVVGLLTYHPPENPDVPLYRFEFFKKIPIWVWAVVTLLAVFFRFYKLTTLSVWPTYDEGVYGFTALRIGENGIRHLFFNFTDIPFFYAWFLSKVFRLFGPSLTNIWVWPSVISFLWIPLAYLAARTYFSRSFSFFCALMAGITFWPAYAGRFSEHDILQLPLVAWAFLWLGKTIRSETETKGKVAAWVLGFSVGVSFYAVYLHWVSSAFVIISTMMFLYWKGNVRRFLFFGFGMAIPMIPFLLYCVITNKFQYGPTQALWNLSYYSTWEKFYWAWDPIKALFWGVPYNEICYKPVWGGLINPVLGALFGVGLLECLKNLDRFFYRWLCVLFIVFLLPAVCSQGPEFYRYITILIVLIPVIGLGWARLSLEISSRWTAVVLVLLMVVSVSLDFNQLFNVYPHLWDKPAYWLKEMKSIYNYRAYQILEAKAAADGPGLIFADFNPSLADQTLDLADYQWNAVKNERLEPRQTKWAALLINVNYQPFLAKRLGPGTAYWLAKDLNRADGGLMLWVIDITDANRSVFLKWMTADRSLDEYIEVYIDGFEAGHGTNRAKILAVIDKIHPLFQGDPFLESCYWEKRADLIFKVQGASDSEKNLIQAVLKGYPSANLFYRLGTMRMITGDKVGASNYFRKAVGAPVNLTQSAGLLKASEN